MQYPTIFRMLGLILMFFSLSMIPPIFIARYYDDGAGGAFAFGFLLTFISGFLLWFRFRHFYQQFRTRDGFVIVGLFWIVLSLYGAIPLFVVNHAKNSFTDAIFESVSGLTTTGASIIVGLEFLPHALRFYRQELQFLGGMGIVVLAVAVMPMLGIGGMQLYRAETPGPMKDNKLTPRVTETAKALWFIYVGLTIACIASYCWAGMDLFDAIGEGFSTVSTGGFSMHDNSFTFYHSNKIDLIAIVFMLLGGTNFALHFLALKNGSISGYWRDTEFRYYLATVFSIMVFAIIVLTLNSTYSHFTDAIVKPMFTVVSFITTTGFYTTQYNTWPQFLTILITFMALIGASGGSTSGGAKMVRFILLAKQSVRELRRLIHPRAVYSVKFGNRILDDNIAEAIWGFVAAYLALLVIILLLLLISGLDLTTAFSVTVAMLANAGIALGSAADNFAVLNDFGKWISIFAMLAGRLEVFSLLVLLTPGFWRE